MADEKKKWIQKAVPEDRKSVFAAKARKAGMSTIAYARAKEHSPGALGDEARLAERLIGYRKK